MKMGVVWRDDPFMQTTLIGAENDAPWEDAVNAFYGSVDQYNVHFLQHLWHAFAVVGVNHPNGVLKTRCWWFYLRGVYALHMKPETREELTHRLRDGVREDIGEKI